jgi:hypothetical protein
MHGNNAHETVPGLPIWKVIKEIIPYVKNHKQMKKSCEAKVRYSNSPYIRMLRYTTV